MNEILLEVTYPQQKKRAVVLIGRFSPPHLGHYKAINQAKKFIRERPDLKLEATPIVVVIAGKKTSLDKKRNPLSPEDRISFMKYSDRANGVIFEIASNAFEAFEKVRERGFEPIAIAAGDDRADGYLELLNNNFVSPQGKKIEHYIVPNLDRQEANLGDVKKSSVIDVKTVSGTMVRAAIDNDYEDVFIKLVGLEKKPKLAKLMFAKIQKAMGEE